MRRLFTFGCSFTGYFYPTWADLLSADYDSFENWGLIGTGTRAALERLSECHARHHFTSDDTVIVQWSLHNRHDYWNPASTLRPYPISWKTAGNIFSHDNRDVFSDTWVNCFYWEPAYVMHSLNHMILAQGFLESTGCSYAFTSIGDWQLLGSDLGPSMGYTIAKDLPQLEFLAARALQGSHWLKPIKPRADLAPELGWSFWGESAQHPSPRQYDLWLRDNWPAYTARQQEWLDRLDLIYNESVHDVDRFRQLMQSHHYRHWPYEPRGL